jgi:hypothetical protein
MTSKTRLCHAWQIGANGTIFSTVLPVPNYVIEMT